MEEFFIHCYDNLLQKLGFEGYQKTEKPNIRFINWMNKLQKMGYTEEEINESLESFDIDKDEFISSQKQKIVEKDLVKKRTKICNPNIDHLTNQITVINTELKYVMQKLDEIEINEFLKNSPLWFEAAKI
uniref:Uncharacterized protein n=1 Tax=Panagrolaimus superbus TaxID=310955 RepID=A0A914Y1A9_9BILA